jgi:hypothetical protein
VAKPIPNRARISQKGHVQKSSPKKLHVPEKKPKGWMIAGFDTSMSSLAGAAIGYDRILNRNIGPGFVMRRWSKDDHYYDRLKMSAKAHELVGDLQAELGISLEPEQIWIAQEEPWPMGMSKGGLSAFIKQQAEISGAFLGGLLRYGYNNLAQMNSIRWRQMIAQELEITTHHSKWRSPELAKRFNCKPTDSGKFRSKQWAMMNQTALGGGVEIPDWPDIIESSHGKIPRPEDSRAKAVQPDDRYDALAIMWTHYEELRAEGQFA